MSSDVSKRACDAEITKLEAELRISKQAQRDSAAELRFYENEQCAAEGALADEANSRNGTEEGDEDVITEIGTFPCMPLQLKS